MTVLSYPVVETIVSEGGFGRNDLDQATWLAELDRRVSSKEITEAAALEAALRLGLIDEELFAFCISSEDDYPFAVEVKIDKKTHSSNRIESARHILDLAKGAADGCGPATHRTVCTALHEAATNFVNGEPTKESVVRVIKY